MAEKISQETQERIMQLQILQQRMQVFGAQKQQLQLQQIETDNALNEVSKTKKPVYALVGEILIEKQANDVKADLEGRKKELDIKIKNLERQEKKIQSDAEEIQREVTKTLK